MGRRFEYEVWIGHTKYNTKASNSREAKRNVAHMHRKRGYQPQNTISQIMKSAIAKRRK